MAGLAEADKAAIKELREALVRAIVAGDAAAYAACYAPDGVVMHPDSPFVRGTAALLEYTKAVFDAVKVTRLVLTPMSVTGEGGVAFETGVQDCGIEPPNEHFKEKRQYLHAYQRQEDGAWKIAAAMSGNQ